MKMPRYVQTKKDWEDMSNFLESQDKSKLVDFIKSNLSSTEFFRRVWAYFGSIECENLDADNLFEVYENDLMHEYEAGSPDTDYIISYSHRFADMADRMPPEEKKKFLELMADFLDKGVTEYGVGLEKDDDWLIYDFIDEACGKNI